MEYYLYKANVSVKFKYYKCKITTNMDKKAQALSLNTIIIAIVVLIVLVVLIMVFTGYFGARFTPEVTSCANAGGGCQTIFTDSEDPNPPRCGYNLFKQGITELTTVSSCPGDTICCAKGLGTGSAPSTRTGPGIITPVTVVEACGDEVAGAECKDPSDCIAEKTSGVSCTNTDGTASSQVCCNP